MTTHAPAEASWVGAFTEERAIRFGRAIAVITMVTAFVSAVIFVALGEFHTWYEEWGVHNALGGFLFGAVLFVAAPRQPHNGAVWALGWSGLFQAIPQALAAAVTTMLVVDRYDAGALDSYRTFGDLPSEIMFTTWLGQWSWIPALGLMFTFALLLFPDGRLPSPRWRWLGWLSAIGITGATIGLMTTELLGSDINSGEFSTVAEIFLPVVGLCAVASVFSLFVRYRTTRGVERHQLRWVAFGASLFTLSSIATFAVDASGVGPGTSINLPTTLATVPFLVSAYAVALLKYRLYDIDVVISKSVMYLGLGAAITGLYVLVVVGPLLVIGASDDGGPGLLLPILATGAVAIVFEPVRTRMQRLANRLVYGERATPHEVLSQVTNQLADSTPGEGTEALARLLAHGTGADEAVVWLYSGEVFTPDGVWRHGGAESTRPPSVAELPNDDVTMSHLVVHQDEIFGGVTIVKPRVDPVTPADAELVTDVAAGSGLLLRNIRLNRELVERASEVRESRRRLIEAQDRERHRLERDLHDGAQQRVVALKVKLGIARTIAGREGAHAIAERLEGLSDSVQSAVDDLRAVAHGIYPPLLESEGLDAALRATERTSTLTIDLNADDLERYGRSIEETAYFCVTETLERAHMSGAKSARVEVARRNGDLVTAIDVSRLETDLDLGAVADRLDAAGGTFAIAHRAADGPSIVASIPLVPAEGALV